jgi:peptide/nickel transport system permease protein
MVAAEGQVQSLYGVTQRRQPMKKRIGRIVLGHINGVIGLSIIVFIVLVALSADLIATHSPTSTDPVNRLQSPSSEHYFGTDNFGRDLFSRTVHGSRISLIVGFGVAVVAVVGGIIFGLLSGYFQRLEPPLMRAMDAIMAFPGIILAIGIVAATGPSVVNVIIALGVVFIPRVARLMRSVVLSIREMQYVEAARSIGVPDWQIISRHIMRNAWSPVIVQATFIFAEGVIGEATLSFLGVGSPPYIPSWGNILGEAREYIRSAPWMMFLPGLALMLTVFSLNLFGDGIRDLLDPRLRRSR